MCAHRCYFAIQSYSINTATRRLCRHITIWKCLGRKFIKIIWYFSNFVLNTPHNSCIIHHTSHISLTNENKSSEIGNCVFRVVNYNYYYYHLSELWLLAFLFVDGFSTNLQYLSVFVALEYNFPNNNSNKMRQFKVNLNLSI